MRLDRWASRALGLTSGVAAQAAATVERRAPAGALVRPNQWVSPHAPLLPTRDGETLIGGYDRNVYAYRAIRVLAEDLASLPFVAGNVRTKTAKGNARLSNLLGPTPGSPNPTWSPTRLWRYSVAQYLILGKFAWIPERDALGQIVELWPLMAQHLNPLPAKPGATSGGYFSGFEYGRRGSPGFREYQPGEIFYCYRPSQADFRKPESPLAVSMPDVSHHQMLKAFESGFLRNNGVPAHLIITPPFVNDDDRQGFREQFTSQFGGVENAGKAAFAEREFEEGEGGGAVDTVEVKVLGVSQKDAQLDLSREATVRDLMAPLGVPMSKLGDASGRTYSNASVEDKMYWRGTMSALISEIDEEINTNVAPYVEQGVTGWHDVRDVRQLRPDPMFPDYSNALELVKAGVITVDEFRADRGFPPAETVGLPSAYEPPASPAPTPATGTPKIDHEPVLPPKDPAAAQDMAARLAELLAEQRESIRCRVTGRRARRGYTQVTAEGLYDTAHWAARATALLSPSVLALGGDAPRARKLGADVTRAVLASLAESLTTHVGEPGSDAMLSRAFGDSLTELLATFTKDLAKELNTS